MDISLRIYEFVGKLIETQLPSKEAFYSRLNDEGISDENYAHAKKSLENVRNEKPRRLP